MKRLIKRSMMNIEMFKGTLNQLSDEGRNILKLIEDYKFKLDQTCRLTSNNQELTQKLQQKRKQLDVASSQIYSIVFDIDNVDITKSYEQQQLNTNITIPQNQPSNINQPTNINQPPQNNTEENNNEENDNTEENDVEENNNEESEEDENEGNEQ